jgi:4-aminobutyrate aminotransferase/(S)-3-amino-2-methylpropionate transaminase
MLQLQCRVVVASSPADRLPELSTSVPGPRSRALAERLAAVESRNVTCLVPDAPIFWERARGANVWDVDGNRFVDLSGAFGVSNAGHAHPRVVEAVAAQADRLLHGMGDVHPSGVKVALLEALVARFPGSGAARAVLGSSGSDAVEVALKTAQLATGRAGVVAFDGAYHGMALGALDATHRQDFRAPFAARLADATAFARYGDAKDVARAADACAAPVGAVLVEPIQARGGERVPPDGFLRDLRALCDARGWLLIADEVYTGCGRTGAWFACDHEAVVPDLLCVAKGLASGMPISACVGKREVMDAWPVSTGEALHTQTFLGHPPSCAAALASLAVIEEEKLCERAARLGAHALERLRAALGDAASVADVRGRGLLIGVECAAPEVAASAVASLLARGVIALPSGDDGRVIGLSPPLTIGEAVFYAALDAVADVLR